MPRTIVDFRPDPTLQWELDEAAAVLADAGVGVLIGEHVDDLTPHRPSVIAAAVAATGIRAMVTVTCRDRTHDHARTELSELATIDLIAVHCVTGDHPAARFGLDRPSRFELDSFDLIALAGDLNMAVSVAESPSAAHRRWRPRRLLDKQAAGASMAVLNHAGDPERLIAFAEAARNLGLDIPLVAPVPVITDHRSAHALARFPGLELPTGFSQRILSAVDPRAEGIDAAVDIADELLGSGYFDAVNLSGAGTAAGVVARAELLADVAERIDR